MLPWVLCAALSALCAVLFVKIYALRKSVAEIGDSVSEILSKETNIKITVTSSDKRVRRLASTLSDSLCELKKQRLRYQCGDRELTDAIANVSHDLRTPVTAVSGYLDLLEAQDLSDDARRYAGCIRNRTEKMRQLTDELFDYSLLCSVKDAEYKDADVREILQESLLSFYFDFEKRNITPVVTIPDKAVVRRVDVSALSRVFDNIIGNAVKYSDGDFKVDMTDDCRIIFSNKASDLTHVDVGRLFDRFFTLSAARPSSGLGLSAAKTLTENTGGEISAEYKDGSLFIILKIFNHD